MTDLLLLAERVEAAEEPDRMLDGAIATALGERDAFGSPLHHKVVRAHIPHYCASLDAALTLVPEAFDWTLSSSIVDGCLATIPSAYGLGDAVHGFAATPALALTAACLRARSTMEGLS